MNLKQIIYSSGDVFLPERIKRVLAYDLIGSHDDTFYISGWSILHLISGLIIGSLYLHFKYKVHLYFPVMFTLHISWELWQALIRMSNPHRLTGRSNIVDTLMDTFLFLAGAYIAVLI
jgi:hypothetical protein